MQSDKTEAAVSTSMTRNLNESKVESIADQILNEVSNGGNLVKQPFYVNMVTILMLQSRLISEGLFCR